MTLSALIGKLKEDDIIEEYMLVNEVCNHAMFIEELQNCDIDYNQGLKRDRFDGCYIITVNNQNYYLVKRISSRDISL